MTELQLYRYIKDNDIEWNHFYDNEFGYMDIVIFPKLWQLDELSDLLSNSVFDDEGIKCHMKKGYVAIPMRDICDHYDIDMHNVFKG